MASARIRVPIDHRSWYSGGRELEFGNQPAASLSDMVFGFFEEGSFTSSDEEYPRNGGIFGEEEEEEEEENENSGEQKKNFWENQHQLLQDIICRTSSLESNIRNIAKEAVKEIQMSDKICGCGRPMTDGCRICLMTEISGRLRNAGYNSAICKTKWRTSLDIPAGEHSFLDVIDNSSAKKGVVRVIIELNFRSEFEMAKASEEYNKLVRRLPELFVGKIERLNNVIKILCSAAKKCMKEKKMHLGPWRKSRYMQAKWLGTCERTTSMAPSLSMGHSGRRRKPKASMLTVDLKDVLPNVHCTAVEVVCL